MGAVSVNDTSLIGDPSVLVSFIATAVLTTAITVAGAATVTATTASALTTAIPLASASTITVTSTGALSTAITATGAATITVSTASSLTTAIPLASAVTVTVTGASSLTTAIRPTAAVTVVFTTASSLTTQIPLTAAATITFTGLGTMPGAADLAGASTVTVTGLGALTTAIRCTGVGTVVFTGAGALSSPAAALAGAATVTVTGASSLTTAIRPTGAATVTLTATGSLVTGIALDGSGVDHATITITASATLAPAVLPTADVVIRVRADDVVLRVRADDLVARVRADDATVRVRLEDVGVPGNSYALTVIAENPEGYWRLGESTGLVAADSSGHGRTGTYSAGVTLAQPGVLSDGTTAALFNGTSGVVDMGTVAALNFTDTFSAEAWVKLTGAGSYVVVNKSNNNSGAGWALTVNNGLVRLWAYTLAGALVFDVTATTNAVHDGAWHHLVGTWNGTNAANGVQLYVDSALVKQGTATGAVPGNTTDPARIGAFNSVSFLYFPGTLDEVAVYSYPLGPQQIAAHYALRTPPSAVTVVVRADDVVVRA